MTSDFTVGHEVEGNISKSDIIRGDFHHDGSVDVDGNSSECNGSCRDDCECRDYCECESCNICDICHDTCDACSCEECRTCSRCDENIDSCECDMRNHSNNDCESCKVIQLKNHDEYLACDKCRTHFIDNEHVYNCVTNDNMSHECDFECGCECNCECDCSNGEGDDGEVVSRILPEDESTSWLGANEDSILRTNNTCGHHIHVGGITNREYAVLMDVDFHNTLKEKLLKWGHEHKLKVDSSFFRRLEGHNSFCKDDFRPLEQKYDTTKSSQRYCFINYCWALHRTVEIRVLPAFQKPELRIKASNKVLEIIHTYLDEHKPKIHSLEIKEVI